MTFARQRAATLLRTDPYPRSGWPTDSLFVTGATVTAGGVTNTKGAWVEQVAATAQDVAVIEVWSNIRVGVAGNFTGMLLDIGTGAAASEVVVVPDVVVGEHFGGGEFQYSCRYWLPVHIPTGTRIAARNQATVISDTYQPMMILYYGTAFGRFRGFPQATALGLTPASSSYPNSGNLTDNAFTEVVASTAERYYGLTAHFCGVNGVGLSTINVLVDVGLGGAGSEVVIGKYLIRTSDTETIVGITGPPFIERDIPAGSRLSLRKNSTVALGGNLIGWSH